MSFLDEVTVVSKTTTTQEIPQIAKDEKTTPDAVKKAVDTAKKTGQPVSVAEDENFSSEYDDNPKLRGGQRKLPDALQRAIINRIKEMADKGYSRDPETGEIIPMSSNDAIQSFLNRIKQSLSDEDSLDEARTKIGKALFGNKTYETPFRDFIDTIKKDNESGNIDNNAFSKISDKLSKLEKGELPKEEFNFLMKSLEKSGYSKKELQRLEKKYNNAIKKKKAVKEEKELKLPADTTFTIDLKHLMQKHGKEDTIKLTKKLMQQLHDKGKVEVDGTTLVFEMNMMQDTPLALPEPEVEKPRRKGPPRLVTFDTDAPDFLGDDGMDYEGGMAKSQMLKMKKYAAALCDMIEDESQLEAWVQAKLTKASDYMSAVYHYLDYQNSKMNENLNPSMMDTDEILVSILMSVARLGEESAEQVVDNLTAEDFKKAAMMMIRDVDEREIAKFILSATKLDESSKMNEETLNEEKFTFPQADQYTLLKSKWDGEDGVGLNMPSSSKYREKDTNYILLKDTPFNNIDDLFNVLKKKLSNPVFTNDVFKRFKDQTNGMILQNVKLDEQIN